MDTWQMARDTCFRETYFLCQLPGFGQGSTLRRKVSKYTRFQNAKDPAPGGGGRKSTRNKNLKKQLDGEEERDRVLPQWGRWLSH